MSEDSNISKLTVAKLKALCKQKGLHGYSKLPKPGLLAKLGVLAPMAASHPHRNPSPASHEVVLKEMTGKSRENKPLETLDVTKESRPKQGSSPRRDSSSTIPENVIVSGLISEVAAIGSKRSVETAFLSSSLQSGDHSQATKKQRKFTGPATESNESHGFKIPDLPKRLSESFTAGEVGICAANLKQDDSMRLADTPPSDILPSYTHLRSVNNIRDPTKMVNNSSSRPPVPFNANAAQKAGGESGLSLPAGQSYKSQSRQSISQIGSSSDITTSSNSPAQPSKYSNSVSNDLKTQSQTVNKFKALRPSSSGGQRGTTLQALPVASRLDPLEVRILPKLKPITFPPSMSQRRRLPLLSLAFSCLDDASRAACVLVSKVARYAGAILILKRAHIVLGDHDTFSQVYLSAQDILSQKFAGQRLSRLITDLQSKGAVLKMTDLWPYLRLREREVTQRKRKFSKSWAASFLRQIVGLETPPISERLWTSPDCEEQFLVSQRFIQTRNCFALSLCGLSKEALDWAMSVVVDTQEVLPGEVWSITVVNSISSDLQTFYVLYQTCEVIGHPSSGGSTNVRKASMAQTMYLRIPLREDWSTYIGLRLPTATRHLYPTLFEHIRGTNTDDFERGISKAWLKRLGSKAENAAEKRLVAEKYVLACVAGNSISGMYKSTTDMAIEFSGIPDSSKIVRREGEPNSHINLFIPERHNVESIHFDSPQGSLHPDLAIVQTAGRQEGVFVLRENGIVIGEDEQVPEVWMKLLGCENNGRKVKRY